MTFIIDCKGVGAAPKVEGSRLGFWVNGSRFLQYLNPASTPVQSPYKSCRGTTIPVDPAKSC